MFDVASGTRPSLHAEQSRADRQVSSILEALRYLAQQFSLSVVSVSLLRVAFSGPGVASVEVGVGAPRGEPDRRVEVSDRLTVLPLEAPGDAPADVGVGVP